MTADGRVDVRAVADRLLERLARTDTGAAAALRASGAASDGGSLLPGFSPDDVADRMVAHREVLASLAGGATAVLSPADGDLAAALHERSAAEIALENVGFGASQLAPLATAPQLLRGAVQDALDAAQADESGWERLAATLDALPGALQGHLATVRSAAVAGRGPARRQVLVVAEQCADWVDPDGSDWFRRLPGRAPERWRDELQRSVARAVDGVTGYRDALLGEIAAAATERDAVGGEVYAVTAAAYLGAPVDPRELADWGWQELDRIQGEIDVLGAQLHPDGADAAMAALDADPARRLDDDAAIVGWLDRVLGEAASALDGRWVDLPARHPLPVSRVSDAGAGVMYYSPAPAGGATPGSIWWAREPGAPVHTWRERTTAHHEGVPGHHLQITAAAQSPDLHPWQRWCCHVHGHAEGWAHHAEAWVGEVGLLDDPADRLGMLVAQAWRAARIVIDTGLHLQLPVPPGRVDGDPPRWTREVAIAHLHRISGLGPRAAGFEVDRYLGWPGQALAFRVGARLFDEIIAEARRRPDHDERAVRTALLARGPMGLGPLRERVLGS